MKRIEILRTNSERSEEFRYPRQLSGDQMAQTKEEMIQARLHMAMLEDEKQKWNKGWKERIQPHREKYSEALALVRSGVEEVIETVYLMADHDAGIMEYFNEEGELVFQRALFPAERQTRLQIAANDE